MKYPKRSQYKYAKSPYGIRNWPQYEAGVRRRGDLTVWLSDDAIKAWRKLRFALDANSGEIVASDLTDRRTFDCTRVPVLIEQLIGRVASVSADGAYETEGVYEAAFAHGEGRTVRVLFPPGRDAQSSLRPSAALKGKCGLTAYPIEEEFEWKMSNGEWRIAVGGYGSNPPLPFSICCFRS